MSTLALGALSFSDTPDVNGALVLTDLTGISAGNVTGTANQIAVTGTTNPVIALASDPIIPGTARLRVPSGTTAQRPGSPVAGDIRYNSTTGGMERYTGAYWSVFGLVLQLVSGNIVASSGTTTIPYDNTAPTNTEGFQIWTQSFTPISATSRILVQYTLTATHSTTTGIIVLTNFAGTTNIGSTSMRAAATAAQPMNFAFTTVYAPGSTATITFSGRIGPASTTAGTVTVNSPAVTLGGTYVTQYVITEIE